MRHQLCRKQWGCPQTARTQRVWLDQAPVDGNRQRQTQRGQRTANRWPELKRFCVRELFTPRNTSYLSSPTRPSEPLNRTFHSKVAATSIHPLEAASEESVSSLRRPASNMKHHRCLSTRSNPGQALPTNAFLKSIKHQKVCFVVYVFVWRGCLESTREHNTDQMG